MATLGAVLLLSAFVISAYAAAASVVGARRRNTRLVESGVGALYLVAAVMTVASGVIVHAFVVGNYSIKYVQRYSESAQPLGYKLASYWGGLDGSVMFWVFLLSLFGAAAVRINKERHRELIPYVVATLSVVQMFFLFLMIAHNNPFATYLTDTPRAGAGLNPLLQNFYMAIHPPTMYLGFVGMTGCRLFTSIDAQLAVSGAGSVTVPLGVPAVPQLAGRSIYAQTLSFDPGVNPASLVVSNGLELVFGSR